MSELVREALRGDTGRYVRDALLPLVSKLDAAVVQAVRDGKPYSDARYGAGVADGVRLALNAIFERSDNA
jgi:hypothetical protein